MKSPQSILLFVGSVSALLLAGCADSAASDTTIATTTTAPVSVTHNPVVDFEAVAESLKATDRSFLSVDANGIYGVVVAEKFHVLRYMESGWVDVTNSVMPDTGAIQTIDGLSVDKPISVTTRDYTGDRENDFLIRFGSGSAEYGSIINSRDGTLEMKEFCLLHESVERPGVLRTKIVKNLSFDDDTRMIEGDNYDNSGDGYRSYWEWASKSKCFIDTTAR